MATIYVSKSGNDSNDGTSEGSAKLTIGAAVTLVNTLVGMGAAVNTISIGDGTYTETVTYSSNTLTLISTSQNRDNVTIAQSSGSTIKFAKGSTGNAIKHITIQNTDSGTNDNGIYGANGGSGSWASYTVEDCILDCQSAAIQYSHACTIKRTKFLVNGSDNGSNVYGIKNSTAASGAEYSIESCLFVGWDKWAINGSGGYCTVRNCTLILDESDQSTSYLMYWSGTNISVFNTIFYGGDSSVDYGLRLQSASSTHTVKNCISFGSTGDPFLNTGSPTVSSQLETNTDVASDGNTIFTAIGDADIDDDYTINSAGLAYQRGLAAELPSDGTDVVGNTFNASNPNIGAFATVASGYSAAEAINSVALSSIEKINDLTKANIEKINNL